MPTVSGRRAGQPAHRDEQPGRPVRPYPLVVSTFRPLLPIVLAKATGAFADAALEIELRAAGSSAGQLAELAAGEADVAHTALDNVVAWSASVPVRVIGVVDLGVAHELVARPAIGSIGDLRGATIGVDSPSNGFVVLLTAMLADAGLRPAEYRLRTVGGLPTRARALAAEEIDACLLSGGALDDALARGVCRLAALRDRFPHYPALAAVARMPIVGARRDALTRYLAAIGRAVRTPTDAPGVAGAVAAALGADPERALSWLNRERARTTGIVAGAGEAERVISESLRATGRLPPGAPVAPLVELLMDGEAVL
jgi:ABC-type nitrate/sulfonate/bicarbonate transport system substrate-binding protein